MDMFDRKMNLWIDCGNDGLDGRMDGVDNDGFI